MKYEYDISMKWTNTDDKGAVDTFDISPENIVMLSMDNNYEEALMPVMYARLSIDKKDMDKMVQHAKTATIVMTLSKMKQRKIVLMELKRVKLLLHTVVKCLTLSIRI